MAGGRPKKFKPEFVKVAQMMAKVGSTETEIAIALGVNYSTFWRWKAENPQFCKAVKVGKAAAAKRVEEALFHRAVGTTRKTQKVVSYLGTHEVIEIEEEVPADVTAAKFWLINQKRKEWQNMPEIGDGADAVPLAIVINRKDSSRGSADEDDDL